MGRPTNLPLDAVALAATPARPEPSLPTCSSTSQPFLRKVCFTFWKEVTAQAAATLQLLHRLLQGMVHLAQRAVGMDLMMDFLPGLLLGIGHPAWKKVGANLMMDLLPGLLLGMGHPA